MADGGQNGLGKHEFAEILEGLARKREGLGGGAHDAEGVAAVSVLCGLMTEAMLETTLDGPG
jgi:hypothetical protein